mgnify:CR=1 FL=1
MTPGSVISRARNRLQRMRRKRKVRAILDGSPSLQLRRQFIRPIDQPMILISQIQRSGGTLVNRLFDGHPDCYVYPSELAIGGQDKSVWPDLQILANANAAFDVMTQRSLNWVTTALDSGFRKDGVGTAQEARNFVFNAASFRQVFNEALAPHNPPTPRDFLNAYHTAFFNCWIDNQTFYAPEKKFVVAFTPRVNLAPENHTRYWSCYPEGYWITVVRDPASWYASARKHSGRYGKFDEAMSVWRHSMEASLELKRLYGERVILLSFANLLERTEDCMRGICERTGLDWSPILLTPTFNGMPVVSNSSFSGSKGIDTSAAKRSAHEDLDEVARRRLEDLRAAFTSARESFDFEPH